MNKLIIGLVLLIIFASAALIYNNSFTGKITEEKGSLDVLRVGVQPAAPCHIAAAVGFDKKLWKKNSGIKTEMVGPFWAGGSPEMTAMRAGEMDVAYVGVTPALFAISQGLDAKIVASINTNGQVLVVSATNGTPDWIYKEPKDLEGKTIATLTRGSIQDIVFNHWLNKMDKEGKLDKSKVNVKYMGIGDMLTALATKQVDGIYMTMPFSDDMTEMLGTGVGTNLTSEITWSGHPCCVLLVSGKLIREHPDLVKKIVKTHLEATERALKNPDEAAEIAYKVFEWKEHKLPLEPMKKAMRKAAKGEHMKMDTNPHHIIPITEEIIEDVYNRGLLKKKLSVDEVFDTRFYDEVAR